MLLVHFLCDLGSRDSQIALWRIQDDGDDNDFTAPKLTSTKLANSTVQRDQVEESSLHTKGRDAYSSDVTPLHVPTYKHIKPLCVKLCEKAEKVRAFAYNDLRQVCYLFQFRIYLHNTICCKRTTSQSGL